MTKYLLKRLARGLFSAFAVVVIVMLLVYSCLDRSLIFAQDPVWSKKLNNDKKVYEYQQWEKYGYVDYIEYADFLKELVADGELAQENYATAAKIGATEKKDNKTAAEYIKKFTEKYEKAGYTVERLPEKMKGRSGGKARLYAYRDVPLLNRVWNYFTGIIKVDNIHYAEGDIENRGLTFTLFDPVYGGDNFAPAIIGNGTEHKYLLYVDDQFPFIHQNLYTIKLGTSYSVERGVDVFDTMTNTQGSLKLSQVTYPTGHTEDAADNLHSATYIAGSLESGGAFAQTRFTDDYTSVKTYKKGLSKVGYSFVIGIISVILSYTFAIPLGTIMARKKDKFLDKLGTVYIVFIIAVPSLAYIFLFQSVGRKIGLPAVFDMENPGPLMYVLPVISLALPSVAGLMKWLRRYMIDQMNSDYVKFARSGGLSEGEIFTKHILKNAIIPVVHGIPGSVLGALVGAIITERVYVVPGAGNLLTKAINAYDNGVIVGVTLFYALLSVVAIILGDILMSMMDPRISFTSKKER